MPGEGKKDGDDSSTITDFREFHTENSAHFEVTMSADQMKRAEKAGLEKVFKLKTTISTSNMVLFDEEGKIAKYNTAVDILKDFCKLRKKVYVERKGFLVRKITREKEILSNKARFILMVVEGELEIRKKKKADLLKELQKKGFKTMSELDAILESDDINSSEPAEEKDGAAGDEEAEKTDYDYLLGMNLWSLSYEKLKKTTIEMMWDRDLEALLKGLDDMDAQELKEEEEAAQMTDGPRKKDAAKRGAPPKKGPSRAASRPNVDAEDAKLDKALLRRPLQEGGADADEA